MALTWSLASIASETLLTYANGAVEKVTLCWSLSIYVQLIPFPLTVVPITRSPHSQDRVYTLTKLGFQSKDAIELNR